MRSHVTRSRASALLLALTLALAPACDCGPAASNDPAAGTASEEAALVPVVDAPTAPPFTSPGTSGDVVASPLPHAVAPSEPKPSVAAEVASPKEIVWLKGTLEEALEQARKENKLVFVDFWTTWCGWCKKLDHDTYTDPKVIAALNEHYVCLSVDAESKIGAPLARKYSVNGYPTLLFLTTDGLVRERVGGYKPPEKFLPIVVQSAKPR